MQSKATTPEQYLKELPEDRKEVMTRLRNIIVENLPKGFEECMNYGMLGYVVPHSMYPDGYHVTPGLPLPFMNLASQKNNISVYHSGIYSDPALMEWFVGEYPKHASNKLDIGKSCIRFKNINKIPFDLIAELCTKMTPEAWISKYESILKKQ
ncbi:MAG: hypothetical protein ACI849_000260 [Patiriisocius sp.]|jgi:hypothetical protein